MKYKIRFQCKSDLRILRECFKLSKEYVANEIGYSVRNLERIEKENAIDFYNYYLKQAGSGWKFEEK